MRTTQKTILILCFLALFRIHLFAIADQNGPKIGSVPPLLTLAKILQGPPAPVVNWDKLKGKVVVLEFWATWCAPCVAAIPHLNDLADQFKDKPVVFICVSSENEDVVRRFLKTHPIHAWVALDDYDALNQAFHVEGIPHAIIVDALGNIAAIAHPAAIKPENLEEVLNGKKCSLPEPAVYTVDRFSDEVLANKPPPLFEVSIREHKLPSKFRGPICTWTSATNGCEFNGKIATVESALYFIFNKTPSRTSIRCKLPEGFYDFELSALPGHSNELRSEFLSALRTTFDLDVQQTTRKRDVYILTQINTNAPGFHRVEKTGGGGQTSGGFHFSGASMKTIAKFFEMALGTPVLDETHLDGQFYTDIKWKMSKAEQRGEFRPDPSAVVSAARERLGLKLTRAWRAVEIIEVKTVSE